MILLTSSEMAKKWNISGRRIAILCSEGRIRCSKKERHGSFHQMHQNHLI